MSTDNTQAETYRWVKASERLPVKNDLYHVNIIWKDSDESLFPATENYFVSIGWEINDDYEVIEWLEKIPKQLLDFEKYYCTEWYKVGFVCETQCDKCKGDEWLTDKPTFNKECLFVTAEKLPYGYGGYRLWQTLRVKTEDGDYLGLFDGEGDEWGDLADLKADRYKIISPIE